MALLGRSLGLCLAVLASEVSPISAQEFAQPVDALPPVSRRAVDLLGQAPTATTQPIRITGVKLNPTDAGLEVILETETGTTLKPVTRAEDKTFIAEIPNAVLVLPEGAEFIADQPAVGVEAVNVIQADAKTVLVAVVGTEAVPTASVKFSAPTTSEDLPASEEEEVEIVVTAEQEVEEGYAVPNSSVGTRTDAAIRDVPQSIQVIPRQVIEDQGETSFNEALRNVSGVTQAAGGRIDVRGFRATDNILSNGVRNDRGGAFTIQGAGSSNLDIENVGQIEVLRGPASVLYGSGQPGGTINITTLQPEKDPSYKLQARIGNFGFYRPSIDFTGPLTEDKRITYRLTSFYENSGSFVDFVKNEAFGIYPVLRFDISSNTNLTLEGTYRRENGLPRQRLPALGTSLPNPLGNIPISRFLGEPSFDRRNYEEYSIGYRLNHKFNSDWAIRNSFTFKSIVENDQLAAFDELLDDNRTALRTFVEGREAQTNYNAQIDVTGKVRTGFLQHDLLFGAEYNRGIEAFRNPLRSPFSGAPPIDIFAPVYGNLTGLSPTTTPNFDAVDTSTSLGIYAQNLIPFGKKVKLLLGGRYDWSFLSGRDNITGETFRDDPVGAFSPRIGLVYQPIQPVSLYASFSRSF
ncbi:MAG: TonB-dependent receptor, partial [Acaryochloridaceae cyanobacterium CSU_3_4]|nr:TonB-dependent receptor [Acaryochloridaceae cyanobacterium CSU_3_4]